MLVAFSIISVLTISFTLLSSDHAHKVSIGMNRLYEIPQRFLFALFVLIAGGLLVIVMTLLLVIKGML